MLAEQAAINRRILRERALRKTLTEKEEERLRQGKTISDAEPLPVTPEMAHKQWERILSLVDEKFEFVIRTDSQSFRKHSQVFLSYGRLTNRDSLKRYGFCLPKNKYNFVYIRLKIEDSTDPQMDYRKYLISKFFSMKST